MESLAFMGLKVGDACQDIEDALSGSFKVSFDFDECGSIVGVNYYQLALSDYYAELGMLTCSASAVTTHWVVRFPLVLILMQT